MDPYLRLRIGNAVFETHTNVSGGKTPVWNRIVNAYLPNGVESIYIQIFDERSFTQDECVAWAHIVLPQGIFTGDTVDEWYQLSGAMGDKQEGAVNLVINFTPVAQPQATCRSTSNSCNCSANLSNNSQPVCHSLKLIWTSFASCFQTLIVKLCAVCLKPNMATKTAPSMLLSTSILKQRILNAITFK
ncbi:Toll-interacting protein [Aphelenchoides bicaudatus]|nr:Toll-interacting protein [Aphelenchoides bicaudatus]